MKTWDEDGNDGNGAGQYQIFFSFRVERESWKGIGLEVKLRKGRGRQFKMDLGI